RVIGPEIGEVMAGVTAEKHHLVASWIECDPPIFASRWREIGMKLFPNASVPLPHVVGVHLHLAGNCGWRNGSNGIIAQTAEKEHVVVARVDHRLRPVTHSGSSARRSELRPSRTVECPHVA